MQVPPSIIQMRYQDMLCCIICMQGQRSHHPARRAGQEVTHKQPSHQANSRSTQQQALPRNPSRRRRQWCWMLIQSSSRTRTNSSNSRSNQWGGWEAGWRPSRRKSRRHSATARKTCSCQMGCCQSSRQVQGKGHRPRVSWWMVIPLLTSLWWAMDWASSHRRQQQAQGQRQAPAAAAGWLPRQRLLAGSSLAAWWLKSPDDKWWLVLPHLWVLLA